MNNVKIYFSDFFDVEESIIDDYGAVNISLINDLPLFVDPFLLFNSDDEQFKAIHHEMIDYLLFLQNQSKQHPTLSIGMQKAWFSFPEVKQTWLGFSLSGNSGRGMGGDFAKGLYEGLNSIFKDFDKKTVTKGLHMEKLCLISSRVGRDKISDLTTNFVKRYLLEYTEKFARTYISADKCRLINVPKAYFNWETHTWASKLCYLPFYQNDFVLLTPKTILTRDDTFINRTDMIRNLQQIAPSIPDQALRFELDSYFRGILLKKKKEMSWAEKEHYAEGLIRMHPVIMDYYIRYKEDNEEDATSVSKEKVKEVRQIFNNQLMQLVTMLASSTDFYATIPDAHEEALKRIQYLKHVIEDQDGYRLFYYQGKPIKRESDLQVIFRLVWYGSALDVNREVNNGRGPVDYKISYGANNATLVEFKLASNPKLKQNLAKQVDVYKAASDTNRAIKVILYFSKEEEQKISDVLTELRFAGSDDIILIDARNDNKPSASHVKVN